MPQELTENKQTHSLPFLYFSQTQPRCLTLQTISILMPCYSSPLQIDVHAHTSFFHLKNTSIFHSTSQPLIPLIQYTVIPSSLDCQDKNIPNYFWLPPCCCVHTNPLYKWHLLSHSNTVLFKINKYFII